MLNKHLYNSMNRKIMIQISTERQKVSIHKMLVESPAKRKEYPFLKASVASILTLGSPEKTLIASWGKPGNKPFSLNFHTCSCLANQVQFTVISFITVCQHLL